MPAELSVWDLLWGASWGGNVTYKEGSRRHLPALPRMIPLYPLGESGERNFSSKKKT
jgi:hypothetical protein